MYVVQAEDERAHSATCFYGFDGAGGVVAWKMLIRSEEGLCIDRL